MNAKTAFRLSAVLGFLAVALGAFGAHQFKALLAETGNAAVWQTAALYHLVHSLVALLLTTREPFARWAWRLFVAGILIFSGSLYALALSNVRALGAITPLGGLCLLGGWLLLALPGREK